MQTHGNFDAEISPAKGITFIKIGLANGANLKPWAEHPYLKFRRNPLPLCGLSSVKALPKQFPSNTILETNENKEKHSGVS